METNKVPMWEGREKEASGHGADDKDGLRREPVHCGDATVVYAPYYSTYPNLQATPPQPVFNLAEVPHGGGFTYPANSPRQPLPTST